MKKNLLVWVCLAFVLSAAGFSAAGEPIRPNILWLSTEDIGPELNCYGDSTAKTPNLDGLASQSLIYDVAWSNYPVCAPARTTIITGMYAASLGAGNMRSQVPLPDGMKLFPQLLREAGYYCTNASKEDYNVIKPGRVWDESSGKADYSSRSLKDQPFFAVFNYTGTHESKIRKRPHKAVIDPATVKLKSYWPDRPEVRQDLAQYYDNLQKMDDWIGKKLAQLKKRGQADNTIVVFFGDHGSGMPRHKRFAGDSGQLVPFTVHVPEKLKALAPDDYSEGGRTNRPIGFVDLAPTMLSVAGIQPPDYMQGNAFMGKFAEPASKYVYGYRDRMDERPDFSRSIRDERYIYVRNYMPFLPAGQFVHYQHETPTTALWKQMFVEGKLNQIQSQFWMPHPPEELYDLQSDPEETKNLASDPAFTDHLNRFRSEHQKHVLVTGDLGFVPEGDLFELMKSGSPRRILGTDEYPLKSVFELANLAADKDTNRELLLRKLNETNAILRYWAAIGLRVQGDLLTEETAKELTKHLSDSSPAFATAVADTLASFGADDLAEQAQQVLIRIANHEQSNPFYAIQALNVIDRLDGKAKPILDRVEKLPVNDGLKRGGGYLKRLVPDILSSQ